MQAVFSVASSVVSNNCDFTFLVLSYQVPSDLFLWGHKWVLYAAYLQFEPLNKHLLKEWTFESFKIREDFSVTVSRLHWTELYYRAKVDAFIFLGSSMPLKI